jgi:hypothetical protein
LSAFFSGVQVFGFHVYYRCGHKLFSVRKS